MAVYHLRATASDLGGGADFSVQLLDTTTTASSLSPAIAAGGADEISFAFTDPNIPSNADWETGTVTVEVDVTTAANDTTLDISVSRVNSSGTHQETSTLAGTQAVSSTGVLTFTVPSMNWTAGAAGDRIRVNYIFNNSHAHTVRTPTIATGTVNTEHTTVISEAGPIVVTPAVLTLVTGKVEPTVILGSLSITPTVRTLVAAVVAPVVVLGSLVITPAAATLVTATVNPTVQNFVLLTPAVSTLVTGKVDPTVVLGSVSVTPATSTLVTGKVDPTVVLGSVSLTPAILTAVAATVDPTVIVPIPQKQIFIVGSGANNLFADQTRWNTLLSTRISSAQFESTDTSRQLIATPGTIRNLRVDTNNAITAGSLTVTVQKNGTLTSLEVVMTSGNTATDSTNEVTVAAGDEINLKFVSATGTNQIIPHWSAEFEGDNDREFNMGAGTSFLLIAQNALQYNYISTNNSWDSTNTNRQSICPLNGTIRDFYIELDAAPGGSETWTFRITKELVSEASSEIVISGAGLTGNATGLSIDIAPGDRVNIQAQRSSTSAVNSRVRMGIAIQADTAGESWVGGTSQNSLTTVDTTKEYLLWGSGGDNWSGSESLFPQLVGGSYTLRDFRVRASQGPGGTADHKYTFRIRKEAADGNSVVTLIDAELAKVDSVNEDSFAAGEEIVMSHQYDLTGIGSPLAMTVGWSAVQFIDPAAVPILVIPAAATLVTGKVDPTVVLGSVSITPTVRTLVAATVNPTVINSLLLTPATLTLVTTTTNPTVVLGSVTVTPAIDTLVTSTVDPVVVLPSLVITPAPATLVTTTVNPTVILGSVSITPSTLTLVTGKVDPTVILGSVSITPGVRTFVAVTTLTVISGGDIVVTPATLTLVTGRVNPTVVLGSFSVTPTISTLVTATLNPTVVLGSFSITPAVQTLVTSTINPTVVLGSLAITPAVSTLVTVTTNPTVVLGSLSITPAVRTFVAVTSLTIVEGGNVVVIPATLTLVTATVNPTVVLGSMTVTPAVRTLVTGNVDPTVILGSLNIAPAVRTLVTVTLGPSIPLIPATLTLVTTVVQPTVFNSGDIVIEIFIVNEEITQPHNANETILQPRHANEIILQPKHANEKITIY